MRTLRCIVAVQGISLCGCFLGRPGSFIELPRALELPTFTVPRPTMRVGPTRKVQLLPWPLGGVGRGHVSVAQLWVKLNSSQRRDTPMRYVAGLFENRPRKCIRVP